MSNKFIKAVNYLKELRNEVEVDDKERKPEELLLTIIKNAVLTDSSNRGSILFTRDESGYRVSNIQKRGYGWLLKGQYINVDDVVSELQKLGINYNFLPYSVGENKNDFELSFEIELTKSNKRTRKNN